MRLIVNLISREMLGHNIDAAAVSDEYKPPISR